MASAFSFLHNYRQEIQSPNYQLIATALQHKQGRIDAGRSKLQSITDQLAILDIVKDEDKEYTEKRLSSAVDIIDKYSAGDLSNSSYLRELTGKLSEVVDDNVLTAITSTSLFRAEQKEWEKHKGTDKYSDKNYGFAMQNADKWLKDGQVGKAYGGGGGFIEFQDLGKKLLDNIGEISKTLHAKWISTGPKEGRFESIITGEVISRSKMNGALELLYNDKDKQQMQINAWSQYGGLAPDDVKAAYNEYYQPRLDKAEQKIKDINLTKDQTTDPLKIAQLNSELGEWEAQRKSYADNSFESVVDAYGMEGAYSTLYRAQFKDNILDTYSYAPRALTKEVDKVSEANLNYELKAATLAEKKRANLEKERVARVKAGIGVAGDENEQTFTPGAVKDEDKIEPPEDPANRVEKRYEIEDQAHDAMDKLLESKGIPLEVKTSPEFIKQMSNLTSEQYITFKDADGIKQKIDIIENRGILEDYQNEIMTTSVDKKRGFSKIEGALNAAEEELRIGANLNSAPNIYGDVKIDLFKELPNYNFTVKENKHGKLEYKYLPYDGKTHSYAYLVKNGAKTEGQKEALKIYKALHLMQDPNLKPVEKRLAKDYVNTVLSKNPQLAKHINTEVVTSGRIKNSHTQIGGASDLWLTNFKKNDVKPDTIRVDSEEPDEFGDVYAPVGDTKTRGVEPNLEEDRFAEMRKKSENLQGPDEIIRGVFDNIDIDLSDAYALKDNAMIRTTPQVAHFGGKDYNSLRELAGIPDPKYNLDITVRGVVNEATGELTDKMRITYPVKETDPDKKHTSAYRTETVDVTMKDFEERGIAGFDVNMKSRYDARLPDAARPINLGNNVYSPTKELKSFKSKVRPENYQRYLLFTPDEVSGFVEETRSYLGDEAATKVAQEIQSFKKGGYQFSAEPIDGLYQIVVKKGNMSFTVPTMDYTLTPSQRESYIEDPRGHIEGAFFEYLKKFREDLQEDQIPQ